MVKKANVCGKRVKIARVTKDMAQVDLAAAMNIDFKIDINQNGISELERGKRNMKDYELIAIAKILDVSPMWLLFGDKIPKEYL